MIMGPKQVVNCRGTIKRVQELMLELLCQKPLAERNKQQTIKDTYYVSGKHLENLV
jgi:hypothetical protein